MSNTMNARTATTTDAIVGRNIRVSRKMAGLSQTELAEQIGIRFQQLQKYEKGTNRVSAGRIVAICNILDIPLAQLFAGTSLNDDAPSLMDDGSTEALVAFRKIADCNKPSAIRVLQAMASA